MVARPARPTRRRARCEGRAGRHRRRQRRRRRRPPLPRAARRGAPPPARPPSGANRTVARARRRAPTGASPRPHPHPTPPPPTPPTHARVVPPAPHPPSPPSSTPGQQRARALPPPRRGRHTPTPARVKRPAPGTSGSRRRPAVHTAAQRLLRRSHGQRHERMGGRYIPRRRHALMVRQPASPAARGGTGPNRRSQKRIGFICVLFI